MMNKNNVPYYIAGTLATFTLLASGVFAAAPYIGFLAPVAALSVGLPFVIGGAIFSAVVIALSAVAISKNNAISEKEAQLADEKSKVETKDTIISEKEAIVQALRGEQKMVKQSLREPTDKEKKVVTQQNSPDPKVTALPYKDAEVSSPEKLSEGVDDLDLATSKNLNHLNAEISSPENEPANEENGQGWGVWGKAKLVAGVGLCGFALYCTAQYIPTVLNGVVVSSADSKLGYTNGTMYYSYNM